MNRYDDGDFWTWSNPCEVFRLPALVRVSFQAGKSKVEKICQPTIAGILVKQSSARHRNAQCRRLGWRPVRYTANSPERLVGLQGLARSSNRRHMSNQPQVLTVAELTAIIRGTLNDVFAGVWVSGELSDVSRPQSGHIYFTLKDNESQIRGVIWRNVASRLRFEVEDGQEVLCCGDVDVYPPRGTYQLIVRQVEPRGIGALQLAFRQLQQKLAAEGLFDPLRKQQLPPFPRRIAFVTSPTGAAVRDFLEVARRRWQGVEVLIIPARVQGAGAAAEIVRGIQLANQLHPRPDVLVVGRGGGSMEDLWCFNEEQVVRAIFASEIPVVSAVGHEIDVTLADFAADVRVATPTEAAERLVPSSEELLTRLADLRQRLVVSLRSRAAHGRARWESSAQRRVFRRPLDRVHEWMERVDELEGRAVRSIRQLQRSATDRLNSLIDRLESLSPLGVLARGYSVTTRTDNGAVVRDATTLSIGDQITTRLASGAVVSKIERIFS